MKKIIHFVLGKANPDRMNGVNKVVHSLAMAQHNLGYAVEIWGITPSPKAAAPERAIPTRLFLAYPLLSGLDPALRSALAASHQAAVFHLHGGFIPEMFRVSRELNRLQIPYLFTPHGSYNTVALEKSRWKKALYFPLFEQKLIRDAQAVHCIGKSEAVALGRLSEPKKVVLIPNGQDMEAIPARNSWPQAGAPVFGFCGRMTAKTKGLDILLAGFRAYLRTGGEGKLMLIGEGQDKAWAEAEAEALGISGSTVFTGGKFGDEKFDLLAESDAFIHTSRNEGMPTAVLEALAFRIPCIVSEATNTGDYIRDAEAGIVLAHNTPKDLATAMHRIAKLKSAGEIFAWGTRGRNLVASHFNWQSIGRQLAEAAQKTALCPA